MASVRLCNDKRCETSVVRRESAFASETTKGECKEKRRQSNKHEDLNREDRVLLGSYKGEVALVGGMSGGSSGVQ